MATRVNTRYFELEAEICENCNGVICPQCDGCLCTGFDRFCPQFDVHDDSAEEDWLVEHGAHFDD